MENARVREIFYRYFSDRRHQRVLSAPLIPAKDPTLLFTNAGMNQFKSMFLQEEKRGYTRAVSIQKCMRVSGKHNDFDEVGKTDFHHTFFEMLGNFSFGDYFKPEAIAYAWELLTTHYRLEPERLWITIFKDDDEAFRIWNEQIGVPGNKIDRRGEKDNFWQMGETGPCGPCSEIHFDRGKRYGPDEFRDGNPRFVEIWNLVFMQYVRDTSGSLRPLPKPSIDTGMGMERLTAILQGASSNYQTDLFQPIIAFSAELAGISPEDKNHQVDLKVLADHSRALAFLIADGIIPANEGRGYVLRRLLRRAVKHGKNLGLRDNFLQRITLKAADSMKQFYPELEHSRDFIRKVIESEEERFNRTLANGLKIFEELLAEAGNKKQPIISGKELFKLADTFGFPLDFARDLATEKGVAIDSDEFQRQMEEQRQRSRASLIQKRKEIRTLPEIKRFQSHFSGYEEMEGEAEVLAVYVDSRPASQINENQTGIIVLDRTPFYAEAGGQVGDSGNGKNDSVYLTIANAKKTDTGAILHDVKLEKGVLQTGDRVRVEVDRRRRQDIAVHHSATHLLHAALREVLGLHVKQAGSHVGPDKLRFDFPHFSPLSEAEIEKVEAIINDKIRENLPVRAESSRYEEAVASGAIAIFEEKYSDQVRVVSMGSFSKELCGGTHLDETGQIGFFKIITEASISAGCRRIEAVAGAAGFLYAQKSLAIFNALLSHFGQKPESLLDHLKKLNQQLQEKEKEFKKISSRPPTINLDDLVRRSVAIDSINAVVEAVDVTDPKQLSDLADEVKNKTRGVAIIFANREDKSLIVASVFKDLTKKIDANIIIKKVASMVNGKGGGRKDFAQAGGDKIVGAAEFREKVVALLKAEL